MKTFAKIMSTLMALCLLVSVLAIPTSAAGYVQPKFTIGKFESRPLVDGKLTDDCWQYATARELTYAKIAAGEGWLWDPFSACDQVLAGFPDDGEGWMLYGWDEDYFYCGFVVEDQKNTNNEPLSEDLWKGDCIQMQIGASVFGERFEMGFAFSQFGATRPLAHQWEPIPKDFNVSGTTQMTAATNDPLIFFVERDNKNKKTTYEIAIRLSYFGAKAGAVGNKIPFAYTAHLYSTEGNGQGYFLEWADGVVGNPDTKDLSVAASLEFAAANTKKNNCPDTGNKGGNSGGDEPAPSRTSTTKPTTSTTKPITTTKPQGGNNVTTVAPVTPGVTTVAPATTTEAPTTTAPQVEGTEFFAADKAVDVDDADTLEALGKDFADVEISAKKYTVAKEKKFGVFAGETLKGVYKKDGKNFVALEGKEEEIEGAKWMIYPVAKGDEVYVVEEVLPTTTPAPTTAPTTVDDANTTTATPTTVKSTDTEPAANNGWIVWVIVAVVVVAAAAAAVVIILKKKKAAIEE